MIKFFIGVILFTLGVYFAMDFAADIHNPDQDKVKNIIIGSCVSIGLGVILTIWGFIDATTPKPVD